MQVADSQVSSGLGHMARHTTTRDLPSAGKQIRDYVRAKVMSESLAVPSHEIIVKMIFDEFKNLRQSKMSKKDLVQLMHLKE